MLKVVVTYPSKADELAILERVGSVDANVAITPALPAKDLATLRHAVDSIYVDVKVKAYLVDVVRATRVPADYNLANLKPLIECGASPRATVSLLRASKAHAFLAGRHYVSPEDVKVIAADALRHRVRPSFEADAEELTADSLIKRVLDGLPVP